MTSNPTPAPSIPSKLSLAEFWPYYILAHQKPGTQWLHLLGTLSGTAILVTAIVTRNWWLLPVGLVVGYGFAWTGHFLVEHNQPATFGHPFLSFVSDYKMIFYILTGRINAEIERARNANSNQASSPA